MAITTSPPRGAIAETIGDREYILMLRMGEVERFEDLHCGIYDMWAGLMGESPTRPTSRQVRDLIALGLVGGGMAAPEADKVVADSGVEGLQSFFQIAQGLLGVALMPDVADDEPPPKKSSTKKKSADD